MNRITALNLARGFTVCMIAPVHTILIYSDPIIYNTVLVRCLAFIAEGPGAQLFMCLMGVYFALSSKNTWQSVITKAAIILASAYALNALKFMIPYLFGGLPAPMLTDLRIQTARPGDHGQPEWLQLLLIGDIFHFAALALPILYMVKRCPKFQYGAILTVLVVMFIAPATWDFDSGNAVLQYLFRLIGGQPPQVFFPLFPWLVYPLAGLTIGYYLKQDEQYAFRNMIYIGGSCVMIASMFRMEYPLPQQGSFYRTEWPETLKHLGIVLLSLSAWNEISHRIPPNPVFRILEYSSKHITRLYCIQWPLIIWMIPFFGYHQQPFSISIILICCTTALTYSISCAMDAYQDFATINKK